ncbi:MAG: glycosyltransferase [Bacteroidales bacterium]
MKIAIIGTAYPYRGGLAAYNERLARGFVSEGHEVTIYTFSLQYPGILFPGKTQYLDGPPPAGLNIKRAVNSVNPFNWLGLGLKIKKLNPDIVIIKYWLPFMSPCFGTLARLISANGHSVVICIFDNVIPHEKRPGDTLLTKYFTRSIHGAVAMSASVLNDIHLFRNDIPAVLNPHPLFDNFGSIMEKGEARRKLGLDADGRYILFFGFIRKYKGLDLLLEALNDERLRNGNIRLVVAGEFYEDDKPYRDLIERLELGDRVTMFDRFINDDEVSVFFSSADLVVQPYRSATQSGVTQIGYHFTKPMLVTDVGGLKEIIPHGICGYVVKPDPLEIAGSIDDFFTNGREACFTANIEKEKVKFSWGRMINSIMEVYNKSKRK